ncbi:MAG: PAS domain S-box protein [Myxococcales bacterium]|nr:PAS domain S-box protein [Myxococcales bacterium]
MRDLHRPLSKAEALAVFRAAFEQAPTGRALSSADGTLRLVNAKLCEMLGYTAEELTGRDYAGITHPEDLAASREHVRSLMAGERNGFQLQKRYVRKDGSVMWADVTATLLRDAGGRPLCVVVDALDVTEQRRSEEQLRVAQKMEAVAHLAGGLAHDFNNFMSVILGRAGFALERLREGDPLHEDLVEIEKAGRRAATLTDQLLALGRRRAKAPEILSPDDVLRDLESMLSRLLGEHITVARTTEPGLRCVKVDRSELEQVILNLAVNARDAMPDGGTLTLDTANVTLGADAAGTLVAPPGPYVRLTVSDTGAGMDEATRERVFDPFFTTKRPGQGTGLGLATVYAIVRRSGGCLELESAPGRGTTFRLFFPATGETPAPAPIAPAPPRDVPASQGTILLVEDDAAVRRVTERMLLSAGYRVLSATGGGDALLLMEQHDGPIDLLLTDVLMPRMSGPKLAERLRRIRPSLRVLFMSGYAAPDGDDTRWAGPEVPIPGTVIPKPIDRATLLSRVREALETPSGGAGNEGGPGPAPG